MRILPILFVLLLSTASPTSSSQPPATPPPIISGTPPSTTTTTTKYQVLYIKNAKPYVLVDHYDRVHHHRPNHHHHRQINGGKNSEIKNTAMRPDTWRNRRNPRRPFYVMLPKGFVPPSGSSPCHNLYPTSNDHADHHQYFECRYVTKMVKP